MKKIITSSLLCLGVIFSGNAQKLAEWLEEHEEVAWVNYPGLKSSKYNALADEYLQKGKSGILTFGLEKRV